MSVQTIKTLSSTSTKTEKTASFIWQHLLLLASLNLMTLGVALCVKSALGSSVISSLPFVLSLAGEAEEAPQLSIGGYTIVMNFIFVLCQILILRRRFEWVQLFQLVIGFFFGWLIDLNMLLVSVLDYSTFTAQLLAQLAGCTVMGIGITFEVRCGSVTMPGEGITIAIAKVLGRPFAKVKIFVDTFLVLLAVAASYLFFGRWLWQVVGPGTLFAMVYVGLVVKTLAPHIGWFDRLLTIAPGFSRRVFGLARYVYRRR